MRDSDGHEEDEGVVVFTRCSPSTCNIATSNSNLPTKVARGGRRKGNGRRHGFGVEDDIDEAEDEEDGNDGNGRKNHEEQDGGARRSLGLGSGIIWDSEGHIVTNYHVINGSNVQLVTMHDGSRYSAKEVGNAPDVDLALLKIDAPKEKLKSLTLGQSKNLLVGQRVYAIGSPFGLQQTLTAGIVSGLQRSMTTLNGRTIYGVVQTDAAINPGSSGGPLLNSKGELIGVNTMIASSSGSSAGVGFAIPVDTVNRVVKQLIIHGEPRSASLGVICASKEQASKLGIDEGALVMSVIRGSGAMKAGLRGTMRGNDGQIHIGDAILAVNGERVSSVESLVQIIDTFEVDDEVSLTIRRDGEVQQVFVKLSPRKPMTAVVKPRVRSRL